MCRHIIAIAATHDAAACAHVYNNIIYNNIVPQPPTSVNINSVSVAALLS